MIQEKYVRNMSEFKNCHKNYEGFIYFPLNRGKDVRAAFRFTRQSMCREAPEAAGSELFSVKFFSGNRPDNVIEFQ